MSILQQQHHSDPTIQGVPDYELVSRWGAQSQQCNICRLPHLFILINPMENHWSLVFVNFLAHMIRYYDSLHASGMTHIQNAYQYLQAEHQRINNGASLPEMWCLLPGDATTTPRQPNGFDCDVFTCLFFDLILQGIQLQATQTNMAVYQSWQRVSPVNSDTPPSNNYQDGNCTCAHITNQNWALGSIYIIV